MEATHACANINCEHIRWTVKQSPYHAKIWQITNNTHSFSVAANQPICPICGEDLVKLVQLESLPNPLEQEAWQVPAVVKLMIAMS